MAADQFDHNPIEGQGPGLDGAKQKLAGTFEQLSGVRVKILDQIEEGSASTRLRPLLRAQSRSLLRTQLSGRREDADG
jgi:hypothetical protein